VAGFGTDTADNMRWLPGRSLLAVTENLTDALIIDPVSGSRSVVASGELISLLDVRAGQALLRRGPRGARSVVLVDLETGAETYATSGEEAVFGPDGAIWARSDAGEFPVLLRDSTVVAA